MIINEVTKGFADYIIQREQYSDLDIINNGLLPSLISEYKELAKDYSQLHLYKDIDVGGVVFFTPLLFLACTDIQFKVLYTLTFIAFSLLGLVISIYMLSIFRRTKSDLIKYNIDESKISSIFISSERLSNDLADVNQEVM